jgi:hypothetical protein
MKATVKVRKKGAIPNADADKKASQGAYIIKDYDEDGQIGTVLLNAMLRHGVLPPLHDMKKSIEYAKTAVIGQQFCR